MARDAGLEAVIQEDLQGVAGITGKAMFGGWAFLLHGNLLLGARTGSLLVRLGKERDAWALKLAGVDRMEMRGRALEGWVRATPAVYGRDATRRKLIAKAVEFVETLPAKGTAVDAGAVVPIVARRLGALGTRTAAKAAPARKRAAPVAPAAGAPRPRTRRR